MRYSLNVKSLPGGAVPTAAAPAPNPAMQRSGTVAMDGGRPWSGEKYDEGAVTDPAEAFAHFTGGDAGDDVEAWLDRNPDGTLIGWVRDSSDIYRYPDPEAWALDVDGAQMQRADAGAAAADPNVDPAAAPAAPAAPDAGVNPQNPAGFQNEPDPAGDALAQPQAAPVPTDAPPHVAPEVAAPDEPLDPAKHAAPEDVVTPDGEEEWDNPFAEVLDENADGDGTDAETPADDATEDDPEDLADGGADEAEEDDQGKPKRKVPPPVVGKRKRKVPPPFQKKVLGGRVQVKHMPGKHNQEDHGNWADDGIKSAAESVAHAVEKAGHALSSVEGGSSSGPKGGKPAKAAPTKAKLNPASIKAMSDEDLQALTESGDLYDMDTMLGAAEELDKRNDIDAMTRGFAKHTQPGSPERQALFDSVIPSSWSTWAAMGAKGKKPKTSKREEIQSAYHEFIAGQQQRAADWLRGGSAMNKAGKQAGFREEDFFNGQVSSTQFRKYASEELQRFFGNEGGEKRMTFSDFAAEFYPSYAKAKAKVGSRYISEFG